MSDAAWSATDRGGLRRILHADADAFFVSVVRLLDPDGAGGQPFLLVGGAAGSRGVVTSASYETRRFGVRSGMPMAQALRLCPKAVSVPVPGKACREKSREIRRVLERLTPIVEPASIDEFYMDLTGTERLYGNVPLADTAGEIRLTVLKETGVTVSIGGGTSRLVSKLAAKQAKPGRSGECGVLVIPPGDERSFVAGLELADIPGFGPRLQERFAERGLRSVDDALALSEGELTAWLGERSGQWFYRRIRAVDGAPITTSRTAKSMSREHTFATDLRDEREIDRELQRLAMRVTSDLRSRNRRARTVTVKVRDSDFTTRQASRTLRVPTISDTTVSDSARALLHRLRNDRREAVRLLGVMLSNLVEAEPETEQLALFESGGSLDSEVRREEPLLRAVDDINEKFGTQSIVRASTVDSTDESPERSQ